MQVYFAIYFSGCVLVFVKIKEVAQLAAVSKLPFATASREGEPASQTLLLQDSSNCGL